MNKFLERLSFTVVPRWYVFLVLTLIFYITSLNTLYFLGFYRKQGIIAVICGILSFWVFQLRKSGTSTWPRIFFSRNFFRALPLFVLAFPYLFHSFLPTTIESQLDIVRYYGMMTKTLSEQGNTKLLEGMLPFFSA